MSNYPAGAEDDPNAPYNEVDPEDVQEEDLDTKWDRLLDDNEERKRRDWEAKTCKW